MLKLIISETKDFNLDVKDLLLKYFKVTMKQVSESDLDQVFCKYDIFWFRLGFKIDSSVLDNPNIKVKVIVCPVTGLDHIDVEKCNEKGIQIISLKGENEFLKNVRATAELSLLLSLELIRNTRNAINSVFAGNWDRDQFKGYELFEKKIAIIGYGRLGKITADFFAAFGANPTIYDKNLVNSKYPIAKNISEALHNAFLCSLHISYSKENIKFFDKKLINMMPKGAYFVNTSRGSLVNESDLILALESGHLAGVATDVLNNEPDINESILYGYAKNTNNVIITPHIGGNTFESFEKTEKFLAKKIIKLYG